MSLPVRGLLTFLGVAILLATLCYWAQTAAPHTPSSPYFAWFGLIAIGVLWLASAVFADDWNPLALAMGADNRLSTSKLQLLLWTASVGFVYAMVYADRVITLARVDPITSVPQNVLIAMGISITSAVAARAITVSQVSANPDNKDVADSPSYDPSALVREDGATTASLTKVQILFWTVVAIAVYIVTSFHQLGQIAGCTGGSCPGLPDIDTTLMVFMGLGHASYIGGKLASGTTPALASVSDDDRSGAKIITLRGTNLGSSGSILINGQARDDAQVTSWTPTAITFVLPQPAGGKWVTGDKISLAVSVGGTASPSITYCYTEPSQAAQPPRVLSPMAVSNVRRTAPPPVRPSIPIASSNLLAGIDISFWQGNAIDWDAVSAQRLARFAYSRASFGANPGNNDPNFVRNHNECKRLGIAFGAYHFFVFNEAGIDQARLFLQRIDSYAGDLCPMVDIEEGSNPTGTPQQMIQNLGGFTDAVGRALGSRVIIYTNQSTWNTYLGGTDAFSGHLLWIANLNDDPNLPPAMPRGFRDWTIYQYSSKGKLPLLNGGFSDVDLDVLKGGLDAVALSQTLPKRAVAVASALAKVLYDGIDKKLKAVDANGAVIFQCDAHNDSVAANAWRPDAGCPPGSYVLAAPESNNPEQPSTSDNDWVGEGRWFIPINDIAGHNGIGIHGGGTCTTPPDANALRPRQGWCPTENCIRLQNEDLDTFARLPISGKPIEVVQPPAP